MNSPEGNFLSKIASRFINRQQEPSPEYDPTALRKDLIDVRNAAFNYANRFPSEYTLETARPALPDTLFFRKGTAVDLISEARLREYELWPDSEAREYPPNDDDVAIDRYIFQDGDKLFLPVDFVSQKGAYYVLFIPDYGFVRHPESNEERIGNSLYDITVGVREGNTFYRLPSDGEMFFLQHHKKIVMEDGKPAMVKDPLPHPKKNPVDHLPELVTIPIPEEGGIPIWEGNNARGWTVPGNDVDKEQLKSFYEMTARGTVCYRMKEGTVQTKPQESQRSVSEPSFTPVGTR